MIRWSVFPCALLALALPAAAQQGTFSSGSDGSDGALTFPAGAGVIDFDPDAFTPALDPERDRIYHFTSITIPAGTTVRLRTNVFPEGQGIVWLATGDVVIDGVLDLSGDTGHLFNEPFVPALAGAGGYGGSTGAAPGRTATSGNGPGGGGAATLGGGGGAGHAAAGGPASGSATPGVTYGNVHLRPLLGGSGGGGGAGRNPGSGGGGGGGALVLASSTTIRLAGSIRAQGGAGGAGGPTVAAGGGGSGGAIRLVAPSIQGTGTLNVSGGPGGSGIAGGAGALGRVRLEAYRFLNNQAVTPVAAVTRAAPGSVFLPATAPAIRVSTVDGQAVATDARGSFVVPDVVINAGGPVTIALETRNIPAGCASSPRTAPRSPSTPRRWWTPGAG